MFETKFNLSFFGRSSVIGYLKIGEVSFLAAICNSGKPKKMEKCVLHSPEKLDITPRMRNTIFAAACICMKQYNEIVKGPV